MIERPLRLPSVTPSLTLAFLLVAGPATPRALKPGVERWPIKTSVPAGADLGHPKKVALSKLIALGDAAGVKKNDSRYQDARIPDPVDGLKEGQILSTTAYVWLVALESDGDYHIQVSDSPTSGDHCLIVEVPKDDPAFESDATLRDKAATVRQLIREKLLHDASKEPSQDGNVMKKPPYMSVVGQLFYDDSHVGDQPRGKKQMKAATLWELHPVTGIQFFRKAR
jgi:hypothetical protein